jgi:hypothetical protein
MTLGVNLAPRVNFGNFSHLRSPLGVNTLTYRRTKARTESLHPPWGITSSLGDEIHPWGQLQPWGSNFASRGEINNWFHPGLPLKINLFSGDPRGYVHTYRMALWAAHFGGADEAFRNPSSDECLQVSISFSLNFEQKKFQDQFFTCLWIKFIQ